MKRKGIAILSAAAITAGSIFGVVFADNANNGVNKDRQQVQEQAQDQNNKYSYFNGSCHSSEDAYKDMVKIMRENGFKDAARYMQTGNYEKMNEFMNSLSEEDYQKMIDIMKENGYASMAQMMESIGREGMLQMHNSMNGINFGGSGMMGGF